MLLVDAQRKMENQSTITRPTTTTVNWPRYTVNKLSFNSNHRLSASKETLHHWLSTSQFPPSSLLVYGCTGLSEQPLCGSVSWLGILLLWPKYKLTACLPAAALWLAGTQHEREGGGGRGGVRMERNSLYVKNCLYVRCVWEKMYSFTDTVTSCFYFP